LVATGILLVATGEHPVATGAFLVATVKLQVATIILQVATGKLQVATGTPGTGYGNLQGGRFSGMVICFMFMAAKVVNFLENNKIGGE
jgi:hypothetical protein